MELLDCFDTFTISDDVLQHFYESVDHYQTYLEQLEALPPRFRDMFLLALQKIEIENNQEMECEDAFLIELDELLHGKNSLDVMTDMVLKDRNLTKKRLEYLHRIVIRGTSDDYQDNYLCRERQVQVVEVSYGCPIVSYIPPLPEEIDGYLSQILKYINQDYEKDCKDIFLRPMVGHVAIAALQPFLNGNTRLARLVQYGSIFRLTRESIAPKLERPALYFSKNYLISGNYRSYISRLVEHPNDEEWNRWFQYNLNMIDEQLYFTTEKVKQFSKQIHR